MPSIQINTKSVARIAAIQTIYQFKNNSDADIDSILLRIREFYKDKNINKDFDIDKTSKIKLRPSANYLNDLVHFTHDNIEQIDEIIKEMLAEGWTMDNLPKLLLSTLRVAICELKFFPNTPHKIIINEYTDIANDMLDSGEVGFVNSVLDKLSQILRTD